jgi:hypothetical protein
MTNPKYYLTIDTSNKEFKTVFNTCKFKTHKELNQTDDILEEIINKIKIRQMLKNINNSLN